MGSPLWRDFHDIRLDLAGHRYVWISHLIYLSVRELPHHIPRGDGTCEGEFDILGVRERIPCDIPPVMTSVKRYDAGEPFDIRRRYLANGG